MNVISISGNLAADPETRKVGDDFVTEFRIGHNIKRKRNGRTEETTSWFTVVRWGEPFAKFAGDYIRKGAKVYVTGQVEIEQWESGGKAGTTVKIRASDVDLETWPAEGQQRQPAPQRQPAQNAGRFDQAFNDDDIPF